MKKIIFEVHELYHKQLHGFPSKSELAVSKMPVLDIHNKPLQFDTYPEAEAWIDQHYATSVGSSKKFQIEKIFTNGNV